MMFYLLSSIYIKPRTFQFTTLSATEGVGAQENVKGHNLDS